MKLSVTQSPIDLVKDKTINSILVVTAFVALPLLGSSISRVEITGWIPVYTYQIIIVSSLYVLLAFRKKISRSIKTLIFVTFLTWTVILGLQNFGYLGNAKLFIIPIAIITGLILNRKLGYLVLGIHLATFTVFAYLYIKGVFNHDFNLNSYINRPSSWFTQGITLSMIALGLMVITNKFEDAFNEILASLRTQETNYRSLFEQAADGIIICDMQGIILMANQSICSHTGYDKSEIVGMSFMDFFSENVLNEPPIRFDLLEKGEVVFNERKALVKNGKELHIEMRSNMLSDARLQIIVRDISDRVRAEEEIKKQQQLIEKTLNTAPILTYVFDIEETKNVFMNKAGIKNLGYTPEHFAELGNNLFPKLMHPKDLDKVSEHYKKLSNLDEGEIREVEYRFLNSEGKYRVLHSWDTVFMRNENGRVKQIAGSAIDITNQKKTEKRLKDSELKYKTLFENANDAIFLMDDERFVDCNEKTLQLFACTEKEILCLRPQEFSPEFQPGGLSSDKAAMEKIEAALAGNPQMFEWQHKKLTGELFDAEVNLNKIILKNTSYLLAIVRDITEKKQLNRNLNLASIRAEEDERGRLARELHDGLGPILSTSKIYVHNISRLKGIDEGNEHIKKLQKTIDEALVGIKEISNNISPHILRNFGLKHAIGSFIEKLNLSPEISIEHDFEKINKYNEATEITLYRILTELFTNTLKHALASAIQISIKEEGKYLKMRYTDNGKGFNYEEELEKKTGFGLMNIQSRVHALSGNIAIVSEPDKGMTVKIELPMEIIPQ